MLRELKLLFVDGWRVGCRSVGSGFLFAFGEFFSFDIKPFYQVLITLIINNISSGFIRKFVSYFAG